MSEKLSERLEALCAIKGRSFTVAERAESLILMSRAAAVLRAVEGAETAYWVPNSRAASDGSYEDGPGSIVMAAEASPYERSLGTPLRLVPLDAAGSAEGVS